MNQYIRHGIFDIEVITKLIRDNPEKHGRHMLNGDHNIGISSLRLQTFARDSNRLHCVNCGLGAKYYAVETFSSSKNQTSKHVNLYGTKDDGTEVLFTHDHRIARSLGGADNLSNSQVMCLPCNSRKGTIEGIESQRRKKLKKELENVND